MRWANEWLVVKKGHFLHEAVALLWFDDIAKAEKIQLL